MNKFNLIFFFSLLEYIISASRFLDENEDSTNNKTSYNISELFNLPGHLNNILTALIINQTVQKDDDCIKGIEGNYKNNITEITKIYEGSSKGFVDMDSFMICINDTNNTYFSIYPHWDKKARMEIARLNEENLTEHLWIFGVCLRRGICTSDHIRNIFVPLNKLFGKPFKLYDNTNIIVDDFYKVKEKTLEPLGVFLNLIPFYLIIIQIFFIIFKIIPVKLFICCLRKKYLSDVQKNKGKNLEVYNNNASLTRQITLKIRKCFSISEIIEDFIFSKKSELFKDEDMTYVKGIKTFGVCFFVFGLSFTVLYNYPLCSSEVEERKKYMVRGFTSILIIFFRFSPALILSSSGYSLSYKFLNFLDKKLINFIPEKTEHNISTELHNENEQPNNDENSEDRLEKIAEKMENNIETKGASSSAENSSENAKSYYENTIGIKFYSKDISKSTLNKIFKGQKINETLLLSEISTDKIPYSMYLNFILRQLHKLFCMAIGMLFFRMSLPIITLMIDGGRPLLYYIYQTFFEKLGTSITNYLYIGNFVDLFSDEDKFLMMQLFCIPMSEFNYFVIGSILVFICYKKKLRLDLILLLLIFIDILFKIIYIVVDLENRNPAMFYTDTDYQRFFFNPIFNMDFYLIGMLFGMVNYVVQNGLTNKESLIKERPFVKIPLKIAKLCFYTIKGHMSKNYIHFIFIVLLLIFSILIVPLLFSNYFDTLIEENNPGFFFIAISLIDIELFIYCFHFVSMASYISGQNLFYEILNTNVASYGMKLGFWTVLCTPTLTYLLIYNNEANISLNFFMVLIYGSIAFITSLAISLILFLTMEMPYKKLVKLFFNISDELNKVYLEDEKEENEEINKNGDIGVGGDDLNEKDLLMENQGDNLNNNAINDNGIGNDIDNDNEEEFKD